MLLWLYILQVPLMLFENKNKRKLHRQDKNNGINNQLKSVCFVFFLMSVICCRHLCNKSANCKTSLLNIKRADIHHTEPACSLSCTAPSEGETERNWKCSMCIRSAMSDKARFDGTRVQWWSAVCPCLCCAKEAGGLLSTTTDAIWALLRRSI